MCLKFLKFCKVVMIILESLRVTKSYLELSENFTNKTIARSVTPLKCPYLSEKILTQFALRSVGKKHWEPRLSIGLAIGLISNKRTEGTDFRRLVI